MGMFYPSSAGTLTLLERYKRVFENDFAIVSERFVIADHFFCFGEDD
jgi:hypothetical protein